MRILALDRGHSDLGTRHFAIMLTSTRRTLVWPVYFSGVGLTRNYLEAVGLEGAVRAARMTWALARPSS